MAVKEIPLIPAPQRFGVSLNNVNYQFTVVWRDVASSVLGDLTAMVGGGWVLDVADAAGNPIASGLPLVTGADLLAQLRYLDIGGGAALIVQTSHDLDAVPTYTNLGDTSHLYVELAGG